MKKKICAILLLLSVPLLMAATGVGISSWTAFTQAITDSDLFAMTDVSDTTQSSTGTNKKATGTQVLAWLSNTFAAKTNISFLAGALTDLKILTTAQPVTGEAIITATPSDGTKQTYTASQVDTLLGGKQAADADLSTWAGITPGTGVGTMLAIAAGSAGGPTTTVWSGTVELNTTTVAASGVIASGACQLLATHITAANVVAASDGVDFYFIGTPTAKTGFAPSANGMLTLIPYSDADGYVQVATCNNTAGSITLNTAGNGATIKLAVRR